MGDSPRHHEIDVWPPVRNSTTDVREDGQSFNGTSSSSSPMPSSPDDRSASAWWLLMLLFFICIALRPRQPNAAARAMIRARQERLRREAIRNDPERRNRVIERSLTTRRVVKCDKHGALILSDDESNGNLSVSDFDEKQSLSSSSSLIDEQDRSECIICFEPFRVGDEVSFVCNPLETECRHVFHHECLMAWVENPKHNDCPSCRYQILQLPNDDDNETHGTNEVDNAVEDDDDDEEANVEVEQQQSSSVALCIMNGLISRARRASGCCSLIGSFIETDEVVLPPPPIKLRRVVSEGPSVRCCKDSNIVRRVSSPRRRRSLGVDVSTDTLETVPESPFRRSTSDDSFGYQTIRLTRSISEGPPTRHQSSHSSSQMEETHLFSAGRIAFQRVSSGIRSRLSTPFDSNSSGLKSSDSDDEDLLDEDDLLTAYDDDDPNIVRLGGEHDFRMDIEMGSPIRRHSVESSE